ncbi:sterigmatocystin 8-O-methyltransferase precursor, partial [Paraphaeosphaeria sporulosa]
MIKMAPQSENQMLDLARSILSITGDIVKELETTGVPVPHFAPESSDVPITDSYIRLRNSLNDAAGDLLLLVNGPQAHTRQLLASHHDLAAYQIAFAYGVFAAVPEGSPITITKLAQSVGLPDDILRRVLYVLCTQRVFEEIEKDVFVHTHGSVVFARDPQLRAAAEYQLEEFLKAAGSATTALRNGSQSPFHEAFGMPLFQYYTENPNLGARFASAMAGIAKLDRQTSEIWNGYSWSDLGDKQVVDIGGGSGHVSIALADKYPNLNITVQDGNPAMFAHTSKQESGPVKEGRVKFIQHNFFNPQPIKGAGVYLLRQITHNWSDADCVKILRAIVPVLEPSTSLLINDTIMPEHGARTRYEERSLRQVDMMMFVALGAKQRTLQDFRNLLHAADPRLQVCRTIHAEGSMGLIEVQLGNR